MYIEFSTNKRLPTDEKFHVSISEDLKEIATPEGFISIESLTEKEKHELAIIMSDRWNTLLLDQSKDEFTKSSVKDFLFYITFVFRSFILFSIFLSLYFLVRGY